MEDRRQREEEKQVSPIYPGDHMHRAARETEEQPHKLLPLYETPTGRNNQSVRVTKPFSYQEIQRIKEDLGDNLEDPEKYIRAFKGVTLLYDLTWKDVMYILGQTLTPKSKTRVLGKAVAYGDEWLGNESVGKMENVIAALPTGNQAVPTTEPDWDYNTAQGRWDQSHFVRCILEGLRQVCSKPLNYGKFADIEQEEKETPGKFLDRLREALRRFTEIDPESEEGKVILKDRFLTQSAPDIHLGLTAGSVEHSPLHRWKASRGGHLHFKEKTSLQVCEYLRQQSHAMPLLHLMTFTNPKMDWCNTLHFNYGHNVT
ncbi:uncharacterized protein LOC129646064 [Bubalus kerabau]|uniref:uncharacterized protein LOC129646064 n=1 Tax=Bubalus carabanensis TaxID=3119969 RepID=UPI00244ECC5C|nr:uncharacterized protein LOC129646064 [Bubalus carabanensis]